MVAIYRKRSVEIEATQWAGNNEAELAAFAVGCFIVLHEGNRGDNPEVTAKVYDRLHSTWVGVKTGQWVIRGIRGEFYPIDESVLSETYERVTPDA